MERPMFTKNDAGFICAGCGKEVLPLGYTSRNHCPFCLCSLHVDVNPGDRANPCGGLLRPYRAEPHPKKGYVILHRCDRCGATEGDKLPETPNDTHLEYLGVKLDDERNENCPRGQAYEISAADSKVKVIVIPTNEELVIARETLAVAKL